MGHCQPMGGAMPMDHGGMSHKMRDFANAPGLPRTPVVQTVAPMPVDRTGSRPVGGAMSGTGC